MDFSPLGLIIGLAVIAPNFVLLWLPPRVPTPGARVPLPLAWVERAGQALCLVVPAITAPGPTVGWWSAPTIAALVGYYALWARYSFTGRDGTTLYRPWRRVPVPMAILPVIVFLSGAGWLSNVWMAGSALLLGIGHIPASLIIARSLRARP